MGCISKNGDNIYEKVLDMGYDDDKFDDDITFWENESDDE